MLICLCLLQAAPGYHAAKKIIKLFNSVAEGIIIILSLSWMITHAIFLSVSC